MGMIVDQVEAALCAPDKKLTIGTKMICVYKELKVTFTNGKVTDAQRRPDRACSGLRNREKSANSDPACARRYAAGIPNPR